MAGRWMGARVLWTADGWGLEFYDQPMDGG